jgi:hypothetical protein
VPKVLPGQNRDDAIPLAPQQAGNQNGRADRGQGEEKRGKNLGHRNLPEVMSANRP